MNAQDVILRTTPDGKTPANGGSRLNHRVLGWLKTVVVSDAEKAHSMRQVGIRKTVRSLDDGIAVEVSLEESK